MLPEVSSTGKAQGCPKDSGICLRRNLHPSLGQTSHCQGAEQPHRPCLALASPVTADCTKQPWGYIPQAGGMAGKLYKENRAFKAWATGDVSQLSHLAPLTFHAGSIPPEHTCQPGHCSSPGTHSSLPQHQLGPEAEAAAVQGSPELKPKNPRGIKVR